MRRTKILAVVAVALVLVVIVALLWPHPSAGINTSCATGRTHGTITGPPQLVATRGNLSDLWIDYQDSGWWFAEPPPWWPGYAEDPYPVDVYYRGNKEIVAVEGEGIAWSLC